VTLSHVCRKWREVAISTSYLWSHICCRVSELNRTLVTVFLERSRNTPLDFSFVPPQSSLLCGDEFDAILVAMSFHTLRWQSVTVECRLTFILTRLLKFLNDPSLKFPCLKSLDLAILPRNPFIGPQATPSFATVSANLISLRLLQVPLFWLSTSLLLNLTHIELCFPPHKRVVSQSRYTLHLSSLCRFLASIPQLEDLSLIDAVPYFDYVATPPSSATDENVHKLVTLPRLKRIEWSYPYPTDVPLLLTFLDVPILEALDLCLEDLPTKRSLAHLSQSPDPESVWAQVLVFDALKELSVHCTDEEAVGTVLRRMEFPVLEKVEIANMNVINRQRLSLPALPRLESIFRDPRLPHLTHLTLSHFSIFGDHSKAMFGYMPALVSLSLDTCTGIEKLMKYFGLCTGSGDSGPGRRFGMRFCPRLESLSFGGCWDLEFTGLLNVVMARNVRGPDDVADQNTRARKIKPLRRQQCDNNVFTNSSTEQFVFRIVNPLEAARIRFVRVKGCSRVSENEAMSLMSHWVDDVLWAE
jgi:hypothetical protein